MARMTRPVAVFGIASPGPIVVSVSIDHHMASGMVPEMSRWPGASRRCKAVEAIITTPSGMIARARRGAHIQNTATGKTYSVDMAPTWRAAKDGTVLSVTTMALTTISVIRKASHQRS